MRYPRSRAWARCISAATLALAAAGLSTGAGAEEKYQRLFVFGDSYADSDLAPLWRVYPLPLQEQLRIPLSINFAVGGARALDTPPPASVPPGWHLPTQITEFLKTDPVFGPRDLVAISIGGNDGIGFLSLNGNNVPGATAFGGFVATLTTAEIQKLIASGAKNFSIAAFSGMSGLQIDPVQDNTDAANAFGQAYFAGLQAGLLGEAQKGARFFILDLHRLGQQVEANPALYGLEQNPAQQDRSQCTAGGLACQPAERNKYFLGPDGLHLTDAGFAIAAAYMANQQLAPDIIAVQPGIVMSATSGFAQSLQGRLDGTHQARAAAGAAPGDGRMSLGATDKAYTPEAAYAGRFTSFAMGTFLGGNRSDAADAPGYDYDAVSGTAGIEYSINRNLILGVAANYTTLSADLRNTLSAGLRNDANVDLDAIQAAAYLSYATRNVFADALVAYGSHDLDLNRSGVIDTIRSSTDAHALTLAARAGYLFDLGSLRAGPAAGVTYIRSRVGGYTEDGDDLLTFDVSGQTMDSVAANLGLRFLAPFQTAGGGLVIPYLNVMLEHQFGDHTRTLTVSQTSVPDLFIPTTFENFDSRTYGRVEGGVTFQLGPDLSASVNAGSTFARDDGQDYRVSAGLNYRF